MLGGGAFLAAKNPHIPTTESQKANKTNLSKTFLISAITASLLSSGAWGNPTVSNNISRDVSGNTLTIHGTGDGTFTNATNNPGGQTPSTKDHTDNVIGPNITQVIVDGNLINNGDNGSGLINGSYYNRQIGVSRDANVTINSNFKVYGKKYGLTTFENASNLKSSGDNVFNLITIEQGATLEGGTAGIGVNEGKGFKINKIENNGSITGGVGIYLTAGSFAGPNGRGLEQKGIRIETLINNATGTIKGIAGIGGKIGTFENSGNITAQSCGIAIGTCGVWGIPDEDKQLQIDSFTNKATGNITGNVGIKGTDTFTTENGSNINGKVEIFGSNSKNGYTKKRTDGVTIKHEGNIKADKSGSGLIIHKPKGDVNLSGTSKVEGNVYIDGGPGDKVIVDSITAHGTIDTTNPQGGLVIENLEVTGKVDIAGSIKDNNVVIGGGSTIDKGITNGGTIGGIVVDKDSVVNGGITNNGTITGNVANNGTIDKGITNNGSGGIKVENNSGGNIKGDINMGAGGGSVDNNKGGSIDGTIIVGNGNVDISNGGVINPGANKPHIDNGSGNGNVNINGWDTSGTGGNIIITKPGGVTIGGTINGTVAGGGHINDLIKDPSGNSIGDKVNGGQGLKPGNVTLGGSGTGIDKPVILPDGTIVNKIDKNALVGPSIGLTAVSSFNTRLTSTQGTLKEFSIKNFKSSVSSGVEATANLSLEERVALLEKVRNAQDYEKALEASDTYMLSQNDYPIVAAASFSASDVIMGGVLNPDTIISPSVKGYTDDDLMMSLDYIFNKQENNNGIYTFAVPYGNFTRDTSSGTTDSNTFGILVGVQGDLKGYGILGLYGSYEKANRENKTYSTDTDDKSYMAGLTYYNAFARVGTNEFYVNVGTSIGRTNSDLLITDKRDERIDTSFDTLNLGADLRFGMNVYNVLSNSILSPEIGVIYSRLSSDAFEINHKNSGIVEKYDGTDIDLLEATLGLRYHRALNQRSKFTLSGGGKAKLWDSADASGSIVILGTPSPKSTQELSLPDAYFYGHLGYTYLLGKNAEVSFNYQGNFAKDIQSHTGFIRFGYWW